MTLTKITSKSIKDNEIVNADLHSAAAIASTKLAKPIDLADNEKIRLGTSQDLEIFHDGNNSIINDNGTGELQLQRAGNTILTFGDQGIIIDDPTGGASVEIKGFEGGNASLRMVADEGDDNGDIWRLQSNASDNNFKIQNNTSGSLANIWQLNTSGDVHQTGHLDLPDSKEIRLGDSDDFTIYHDGSNSFIRDVGTGILSLDTNGTKIQLMADGTSSKTLGNFIKDGAVELYHNGTKKFETAAAGATIHSTTDATLYISNSGDGTSTLSLGNTGSTNAHISNTNAALSFTFSGENAIIANANADVQLYHNNELRFQTTSTGAVVRRNDDNDTDVYFIVSNDRNDTASDAIIRIFTENGNAHCRLQFGDAGNNDTGMIDYDHANNDMTFSCNGTQQYEMDGGAFHPLPDNARDLGRSGNRWDDVRATNTSIVASSDRNVKNTIVESDLGLDFVNKLKPVSYKLNVGKSGRTHYGLISQDIEDLLPEFSKTAMDFAGFCKDTITVDSDMNELETPKVEYSLRYGEFISPMIKAIQELSAKVAALEAA